VINDEVLVRAGAIKVGAGHRIAIGIVLVEVGCINGYCS
jgi:hypothetical protein